MEPVKACRCCLLRPPDKDLKSPYYGVLGKTEIYTDMLKECFEIHITAGTDEVDGICEPCITRLRDACDFKHQVQQCQKQLLQKVETNLSSGQVVKDESAPKVKEELTDVDDENGIYLLGEEVKEELSDFEDNKNLGEVLGFNNVSIKKKTSNKRRSSRQIVLQHDNMKISLRALSQMNILKPVKVATRLKQRVSENFKHQFNIQNIMKNSNCTPFANKTLCGIICAYCRQAFQLPDELRTHTLEHHKNQELHYNKRLDKSNLSVKLDITELQCTVCNKRCDNISILKKHLTEEHNVKLYPERFDYILEFKLSADQILDCALCHSRFETFKMCLQHMNGHYRNFICDVCDMGFINKHRLKNHQRTHETGTFKCSYCEKIFTTRVGMMCHEKYTHNTAARYKTNCPHCSETFTSYYQRNRHMNKEHNIPAATYKCNICDKSFILKSKLTSHIKKVHLMERNHTCPECGQGFFIKQSLDEHMIKHRGERVFKCTVCQKAYARKKTLIEHMRIHNNDRRFKCGVCELAFVQKCSLKSHMLSNHGVTLNEYESARNNICTHGKGTL